MKKYILLIIILLTFRNMPAQITLVSSDDAILVNLDSSDICEYKNDEIKLTKSGFYKISQIDFTNYDGCELRLYESSSIIKINIFHENQSIAKFCPYIEYSHNNGITSEMKIKIHPPTSVNNKIICNADMDTIRDYFKN